MRWEFGRRSTNVEDRRGARISAPVVGGGIGAVILSVIVALLGGDPSVIWEQQPSDRPDSQSSQTQRSANSDRMADFVSVVLADTEDTWSSLFQQQGKTYREPTLVLYSDAVESACGFTRSAVGPFYCPSDQKLYIDLSFYGDLKNRYQAPGDFAQAYVVAHEVGHHVQNLMGISQQVRTLQRQADEVEANQLSVRQELQADCFAGVWAYHADRSRQILESGDIEEALNAASSIGDDRLQNQARGYVIPESFTHGSSAQRVRWFKRGIQTGNPEQCNTFKTTNL
ncbi:MULTISPECIES: KPN_02809 family neutral zinc metallopeptidase [unclassified Tolypothrix]|uniref:KPN_02809 family neutral zinc metallopeptidase n=1 Tax=unclassified Tolypothrix TaxID=2649714 RepID=UPI0005EAA84A|nr:MULTISPECIES: neutral zinc metallopeptidase [unclassified Tolypothrix]BAY93529.1 neutral zinc metallopeptidase family protein [Microchaete diplosiphon NIES-3275]EKE99398.1 zinc-binding protein [Tolypothrix sp. PCC 7601]MBE9087467.1 neutral zinc metallopeptidase [Tolypothrix sp. LEGE 11397]UYD27365.1 neutral zinc metallopeptidase [Tolypothrix sp. PCC 7712]UYD36771.1 neutral zinc metallopeptidase [Tolypothrix sp. PCC 7601]